MAKLRLNLVVQRTRHMIGDWALPTDAPCAWTETLTFEHFFYMNAYLFSVAYNSECLRYVMTV